jgi:hypothetical protein
MGIEPMGDGLTSSEQSHLALVQGIISRQAGNSFLIKGWALTIAVALDGFAIGRSSWQIAALGVAPVLIFAWLDAYYFRQERLFRCLYDAIIASDRRVKSFSMTTDIFRQDRATQWRANLKSIPYTVLYSAILAGAFVIIGVLASGSGH